MTDTAGATIAHPALCVTQQAIAFGAVGACQPLPVADRSPPRCARNGRA